MGNIRSARQDKAWLPRNDHVRPARRALRRWRGMQANPDARRFWEWLGYAVYDERSDNDKRRCWLMRKVIALELQALEAALW